MSDNRHSVKQHGSVEKDPRTGMRDRPSRPQAPIPDNFLVIHNMVTFILWLVIKYPLTKQHHTIIILTLSALLFSYSLNAEEKNYCNDPDANMQWEALIQEDPDDMQIHALHALRLGLCFKVDRGDLSVDKATEIFENMRSALIDAKESEREEELEEGEKEG